MTIFISYTHNDYSFVEKLALGLIKNKVNIWIDKWELNIGDSIINKIQDAINYADALLVILSKSSVNSEWCKKELSSALIRELDEKRVLVLPILIEDCDIPIFLRDKMYADFRADFDGPLHQILNSIAHITNIEQGRFVEDEEYSDWSLNFGFENKLFYMLYTIVHPSQSIKMTFITEIKVICNNSATARYVEFDEAGLGHVGRCIIAEALIDLANTNDFRILLEDITPKKINIQIQDFSRGYTYDVEICCRRLGEDNGKNQIIDINDYLLKLRDFMLGNAPGLSKDKSIKLKEIIARHT